MHEKLSAEPAAILRTNARADRRQGEVDDGRTDHRADGLTRENRERQAQQPHILSPVRRVGSRFGHAGRWSSLANVSGATFPPLRIATMRLLVSPSRVPG